MAAAKPTVPRGADARGAVAAIVSAMKDLSDEDYSACAHELLACTEYFDDADMVAFFSIKLHYYNSGDKSIEIVRSYLQRGGSLEIALKCQPEAVTSAEIVASGMNYADILDIIACESYYIPASWIRTLNPELRRHLLCLARPDYVDQHGHADLVPALEHAGAAVRHLAKLRDEMDELREELSTANAQLARFKEGMEVVYFGSSTISTKARVPVYSKLLGAFAPGYFENIVKLAGLPGGSAFEGPVLMHVRAQQAFAYAVEHNGKFPADEQITIFDEALDRLTLWEHTHIEHIADRYVSHCISNVLALDFETAAQLAAFCRAITSKTSDLSHDLYMSVGRAYLAAMDVNAPLHLETWCEHVWPPDDLTVQLYEKCAKQDTFGFSDTFDIDKQKGLLLEAFEKKRLEKKRKL